MNMDWITRAEVARILHRQPRWVTENLFQPKLLSYVKIGNEYFVEKCDMDAFMRRFKQKGKLA